MINIKQLKDKKIILLVLPSKSFSQSVMEIVKQLSKEKMLYVTLNNPYNALIKLFKEKKIKTDKLFFIDAISATTKVETTADNCIYVSSPKALTQLSIAITQTIKTLEPTNIIFDSLSTLLIYLPEKSIIGFCQSLSTKAKTTDTKLIFPIINNKELISNISMFVDDVVEWK